MKTRKPKRGEKGQEGRKGPIDQEKGEEESFPKERKEEVRGQRPYPPTEASSRAVRRKEISPKSRRQSGP